MKLNVQNGTICLCSGELKQHDRLDRITKMSPVVFDPQARCERWDRFLLEALGDAQTIEFLQRAAGYCLTGDISEEKLFLVLGEAGTGKTTFVEAMRAMLGDYAQTAGFETFLKSPNGASGRTYNAIAQLRGSRFVSASESDRGRELSEGLIKGLTGGDAVRAWHLYQDSFEFLPTFKLWLAANHAPKLRDDDTGLWRRVLRIPFERPPAVRDNTLKPYLKHPQGGGPAILAWAVRGCLAWQKDGLGEAPAVVEATARYRQEMNPLDGFFSERLLFGPYLQATAKELRAEYEKWAHEQGTQDRFLMSPKAFADRLTDAGCENRHKRDGSVWFGVAIRRFGDACDDCEPISTNFHHEREQEGSYGNSLPKVHILHAESENVGASEPQQSPAYLSPDGEQLDALPPVDDGGLSDAELDAREAAEERAAIIAADLPE